MEEKSKLDQDFENFNLAIEKMADVEIEDVRFKLEVLRLQAVKLGDALAKSEVGS